MISWFFSNKIGLSLSICMRWSVVRWCWVNFQCRTILQICITVRQGPTALAVGSGGGCLDIFSLVCLFSLLSPSLWEMARYRLKYCLKGPLSSNNQPTNQLSICISVSWNFAIRDGSRNCTANQCWVTGQFWLVLYNYANFYEFLDSQFFCYSLVPVNQQTSYDLVIFLYDCIMAD